MTGTHLVHVQVAREPFVEGKIGNQHINLDFLVRVVVCFREPVSQVCDELPKGVAAGEAIARQPLFDHRKRAIGQVNVGMTRRQSVLLNHIEAPLIHKESVQAEASEVDVL